MMNKKTQDRKVNIHNKDAYNVLLKDDEKKEKSDEEEICPICFKKLENTTLITTLLCGHSIHKVCIRNWVNGTSTNRYRCPVCRIAISPTMIYHINQIK